MNWSKHYSDTFKAQTVLITGGAGFIGSHLAAALLELGADVRILDNFANSHADRIQVLKETHPQPFQFLEGSVTDPAILAEAAKGCLLIFHQAALGSVPQSIEQPELYHAANTTGTLNVLEAARHTGARRVMFASSASVYGTDRTLPKVETMPVVPVSPYASSKAAGEAIVRAYAHCYALDTVSLRYFNVFGPHQRDDSAYAAVIAAFAHAMRNGEAPTIFGDGTQTRDFTYVANVVHANLLAAQHNKPLNGTTLNVATGKRISLLTLFETMAATFNLPDLTPRHAEPRPGDVFHSQADIAAIQQTLNYTPLIDFEQGLAETVAWYAQH